MRKPARASGILMLLAAATSAQEFRGTETTYRSPDGVEETCIAIAAVPGGRYSDTDRAAEAAFCSIDFYDGTHALCPKTFSTSPGTLVYDLAGGAYDGNAAGFERAHCATHSVIRDDVRGEPISYKMTMNTRETSATFAPAALLYYHFSRYFDTHVIVPVSVYRSMDRKTHYERVVRTGVAASAESGLSPMNRAAWRVLEAGARDPSNYRPASELYTRDGSAIYGVMLRQSGRRYGEEMNGTRESGWGAGQNRDFQETAPYLALRFDGPLPAAIDHGIVEAMKDPTLRKAMATRPSAVQMAFWMRDLTEIVLLDFIFSQQDRVGNIDYVEDRHWLEEGRLASAAAGATPAAGRPVVNIRRSVLNDNDAGGRIPYANFAKTTGMLEKIRHIGPQTYGQLLRMAADFDSRGDLYHWLQSSFRLSQRQFDQVVRNTVAARDILQRTCLDDQLRFSLDGPALIAPGAAPAANQACRLD